MTHTLSAPEPLLIDGSVPSLKGFYFPPAAGVTERLPFLVVPGFAEEMNRCRAMVRAQVERLRALGHGVMVLDPIGTGDSPGEFVEASLASWLTDLRAGVAWLRSRHQGCAGLLGVRLGALLALHLAAEDAGLNHLLLWQPVMSGKNHWTQFLRIRIAAEMQVPDGARSTEALRKLSRDGLPVEASGYAVGPALAQGLDDLVVPPVASWKGRRMAWFEVLGTADLPVPPAQQAAVEKLRAAGAEIDLHTVQGPAFWHVHERAVAPELLEATTTRVAGWALPGSAVPATEVLPLGEATEQPVTFACGEDWLTGTLHAGRPGARAGMVIVVAGGPQYRAGAHRQFVSLARLLASQGMPVLRFDLRGMGDSSGEYVGFQHSVPDIRAAIDAFQARCPSVKQVVLFGECESASGILFYGHRDARVVGAALANPWVRTQEGQAEVILKHYYRDRLMSREFWQQLFAGRLNLMRALASFGEVLRTFIKGRKALRTAVADTDAFDNLPLPVKTAEGLRRYAGRVLILMSGLDYIAKEFDEVTRSAAAWKGLLEADRVTRVDIADADHTFSKPEAKAKAQGSLLDWLAGGGLLAGRNEEIRRVRAGTGQVSATTTPG